MYGCESWTIKKAESQRTDVFELWCWRRLWRVPWTARRSIQSILKEISPEYSLEGLMLKLKLQYCVHLMWRTDSFEKTLMLERWKEKGMTEDEMVGWHHRHNRHGFGWTPGIGDGQGGLACCSSWGLKESDTTERLNWTHASKVTLKILHARLQHYTKQELPDVLAGFRKRRGTRDQIANMCWITEKAREFQKNIYCCFINYTKAFWLCGS